MTNPLANPVARVVLHPLLIVGTILSFLSNFLPEHFHLASIWIWLIGTVISMLTLVSAQMTAQHVDLAVPVNMGTFHLWLTACTIAGAVAQLLGTSLAQATTDGTVPPSPLVTTVIALLALLFGLAQALANQLHLAESDGGDPPAPPAAIATATATATA